MKEQDPGDDKARCLESKWMMMDESMECKIQRVSEHSANMFGSCEDLVWHDCNSQLILLLFSIKLTQSS